MAITPAKIVARAREKRSPPQNLLRAHLKRSPLREQRDLRGRARSPSQPGSYVEAEALRFRKPAAIHRHQTRTHTKVFPRATGATVAPSHLHTFSPSYFSEVVAGGADPGPSPLAILLPFTSVPSVGNHGSYSDSHSCAFACCLMSLRSVRGQPFRRSKPMSQRPRSADTEATE